MNADSLIKDIIEKIKLWFKNLFKKNKSKKQKLNNEKQQSLKVSQQNQKKYHINGAIDNGNKSTNIGTFYPKLSKYNLSLLNRKGLTLKKKIASFDQESIKDNIDIIDDILTTLNENNLYLNQAIEINDLLNNLENDQALNLNTNQKLNILKDNISNIIDKKLDDYEVSILKKAYSEYDSVNYVIVTTLIIDDIIDEINELNEAFKKNKYTKIEYEKKLDKIKDKIDKLETINHRKEIQEEIENLRKDYYTKSKDKYDLLYNEEIFINLTRRCDELLNVIIARENQKETKTKAIVKEKTKSREELKKKLEVEQQKKDKLQEQEEIEFKDNILKRFIDMEFAHKLLKMREKIRKRLTSNDEIYHETMRHYNEFLLGETHEFNFDRNRIKTEVAKLYNDITSTICMMEKRDFIPLEHINIKLEVLTTKTIEHQTILNYMIVQRQKQPIEQHETSKAVTAKLNGILEKEKSKEKHDGKILKKQYQPKKKEDHYETKN